MERYQARSRSQSEGSADRTVSEQQGDFQRSVSLSRELTSELDAVAEEDRTIVPKPKSKGAKGGTAASSTVPHYPKELLDKIVDPDDNYDTTT
eukprot:8633779-Karenia_brevis.AAC.1